MAAVVMYVCYGGEEVKKPENFGKLGKFEVEELKRFLRFGDLVGYLLKKGNLEHDSCRATVIVIDEKSAEGGALDELSFSDKELLIKYFFCHHNVIVLSEKEMCLENVRVEVGEAVGKINGLIDRRIRRVQTWTGSGLDSINDSFGRIQEVRSQGSSKYSSTSTSTGTSGRRNVGIEFGAGEVIATMSSALSSNLNKSLRTLERLQLINSIIFQEINFLNLLSDHSDARLTKLCHLVGCWLFPAHELSNDDLAYCVYLMLKYALDLLKQSPELYSHTNLHLLSSNELLGFVLMIRDTYKNGNPFHNFRHATDVVQACFHFLIRLNCLVPFEQYSSDPKTDELELLNRQEPKAGPIELVPCNANLPQPLDSTTGSSHNSSSRSSSSHTSHASHTRHTGDRPTASRTRSSKQNLKAEPAKSSYSSSNVSHLNPLQAFGLLVAALGHDVGHPGVTNAFMIKYNTPTSLVYNNRSVLELYHSSIFISKVLEVSWPSLLEVPVEHGTDITVRNLIISCILATDMGEHFDYINRLAEFKANFEDVTVNRVRLISSLLIKCADISNVTRPLRVSSQWAMALAREFDEIAILERYVAAAVPVPDIVTEYDKLPVRLDDILRVSPNLHKGQIFFIDTFAENLFNSIADLLPQLTYSCNIIRENKHFWLQFS